MAVKKRLILIFLVLALGFGLFRVFLGFRRSSVRLFSRLNFVFFDSAGQLAIFSFQGEEGQILPLLADSEVNVPGGFGTYKLGKVYGLGELEKRGRELLAETIRLNFSMGVFGNFFEERVSKGREWQKPKDFFRQIFFQSLRGRIKTDLNCYDLILLYSRAGRLNESLVKVKELKGGIDFSDKRLSEEALSLEVLNATSHNGLAQKTAKLLEDAGGRVVRSADAEKLQADCEIKARNEAAVSYTVLWLKKFFPCRLSLGAEGSRADIVLTLGEDYWKKWGER